MKIGEESDGDSSESLEESPSSTHYSELTHSIVLDDDTKDWNLHDVLTNIINAGDGGEDKEKTLTLVVSRVKNDMEQILLT